MVRVTVVECAVVPPVAVTVMLALLGMVPLYLPCYEDVAPALALTPMADSLF